MKSSLVSICDGKLIPLRMVSDSIFSQRLAGDGIGIVPSSSHFVAPIDGVVRLVMKGGHSMVIQDNNGTNIMVHIGIDTVNLNGVGITSHVKKDQVLKAGDLICEVDLEFMHENRVDLTSVILVMEPREVTNLELKERGLAKAGQTIIIEFTKSGS